MKRYQKCLNLYSHSSPGMTIYLVMRNTSLINSAKLTYANHVGFLGRGFGEAGFGEAAK